MKKLMITALAFTAFAVFAETEAKSEQAKPEEQQIQKDEPPIVWGFANYGIYSGYQLYGSLVNPEPTLQGYGELNFNLPFSVGAIDNFGHLGVGVWSNTDLTGRRGNEMRRAFNEWDFNIHWDKIFWFNEDMTWGLDFRTWVCWYWYPPSGQRITETHTANTKTTFDWDFSFALINPYVTPYVVLVHEYVNHGSLCEFGVNRKFFFCDGNLTIVPLIAFVARDQRYGWCFPNWGVNPFDGNPIPGGMATMKFQLDATYMFTKNIGIFAKVAYCGLLSDDLREACDNRYPHAYGCAKDFAWGGCGVTVSF